MGEVIDITSRRLRAVFGNDAWDPADWIRRAHCADLHVIADGYYSPSSGYATPAP